MSLPSVNQLKKAHASLIKSDPHPALVIPRLYVGSVGCTGSVQDLSDLYGVTHVVCLSAELRLRPPSVASDVHGLYVVSPKDRVVRVYKVPVPMPDKIATPSHKWDSVKVQKIQDLIDDDDNQKEEADIDRYEQGQAQRQQGRLKAHARSWNVFRQHSTSTIASSSCSSLSSASTAVSARARPSYTSSTKNSNHRNNSNNSNNNNNNNNNRHEKNINDVPTFDRRNTISSPSNIKVLHVPIYDLPSENILVAFEQAKKFMLACLQNGGTLLVHCFGGRSRSCAIVILFLINFCSMSLDGAYAAVERARPQIKINPAFMRKIGRISSF